MNPRESRYVTVARLAYQIAPATLPRYSHPKSPQHFTVPQVAVCVLLTVYWRFSYRAMEEWLLATDQVRAVLELPRVPDHSPLARTGGRYHDGLKGGYAVGTQTQGVVGGRRAASGSDIAYLTPLRRQAQAWGRQVAGRRAWVLWGDAGFDGRATQVGDLIPVQTRGQAIKDERRLARAALVTAARLDGVYGPRWKVETVIAVIKRQLGDTIRSRWRRLQFREPLLKALVYNCHV